MRPLLFVSLLCLSGQGYSAAASHGFSTGGPGLAEAHTESDYPVAEGPTSDVICWFISERHGKALADAALEAAEYARAAAWAVTGAGPDSAGRLVVHVYEKRKGSEGFAEAVDSVETGASEGVASWHHSESLGVYVKLQPVVTDYLQAELGFPRTSLHHIARETALLEFSLAGAAHSNTLPRWLHEGLAVHIADRALVDAGRMLTGGMDPLTSTRVHEVRRIRSAGRLPMVESWCAGEVGDLESHQIAAVDAVLLRFLCDRLGEEPLGSMAGAVLRGEFPSSQILPWLADTHGLTDIEEELHPWLDGLVAPWDEPLPSLAPWGTEGGWIQASSSIDFALAWNGAPPAEDYVITAEIEMYRSNKGGMSQLNFALGRLPGGEYVSFAFNSKNGLLVWDYSPDRPEEEGQFEVVTPIALGTGPIPRRNYRIRLVVVKGEVRTFVKDLDDPEAAANPMRTFSVEGRPMGGPWGIGTIRGGATIWKKLTIEPYDPEVHSLRRRQDGDD